MTGYLIRRFAQSIIVVFGVVLLTFLLSHLVPERLRAARRLGPRATPAAIQQFNHENRYDRSIFYQFWKYI